MLEKEGSLTPAADPSMMQASNPVPSGSPPPLTGGRDLADASAGREIDDASNNNSVTINNSSQQAPAPATLAAIQTVHKPCSS